MAAPPIRIAVLLRVGRALDADLELTADGTSVDPAFSTPVLEEAELQALDVGVRLAAGTGSPAEVVALAVTDAAGAATLRTALAYGAARVVAVVDPSLDADDPIACSAALAPLVAREAPIAVIAGDALGAATGVALARRGGYAHVTSCEDLAWSTTGVEALRALEDGVRERVSVTAPSVFTLSGSGPPPGLPSFAATRRAAVAEIPSLALDQLDLQAPALGLPRATVVAARLPPPPTPGRILEGSSDAIADQLLALVRGAAGVTA